MTTLDNNNMNDIQNWSVVSFLTGLFNTVYNALFGAFDGLSLGDWLAVGGFLGMIFSLFMQRHYNRKRDRREEEKAAREEENHEWKRQRVERSSPPISLQDAP